MFVVVLDIQYKHRNTSFFNKLKIEEWYNLKRCAIKMLFHYYTNNKYKQETFSFR